MSRRPLAPDYRWHVAHRRSRSTAGMVPFWLKVKVCLCALLGFIVAEQIKTWGGASEVFLPLALVLIPKALAWNARRLLRRNAARRIETRRLIEAGRKTAVSESLWWPESDGSVLIGAVAVNPEGETDDHP